MHTETARFGEFSGYLVEHENLPAAAPAVIVIQEAWGLNAHIEDVTRRIAQAGYVALAPDIYARNGSARRRSSASVSLSCWLSSTSCHPAAS